MDGLLLSRYLKEAWVCTACLATIFRAHQVRGIRTRMCFAWQEQRGILREDFLAGKLAWLRSHFIVCGLCHRTKERLPETSAVVLNKRQVTAAVKEIIESLLKGRTAPVVVQGWTIWHPGLRLWLWLGLWFRFTLRLWLWFWLGFRLRLRLGFGLRLWIRCRAI
jgi:hypothetical protein